MKVIPLFPTKLYAFEYEEDSWRIPCVEKEALGLRYAKNTYNYITPNMYVLKTLPFLSELRDYIDKCLAEYVKAETGNNDVQLCVTQSWFNVTEGKQAHHEHSHHNSFVSGVVYINAAEGDIITFHPFNNSINLFLKPHGEEPLSVSVNTGDLILFPSNLAHSVPFLDREYRRLSLAFNTFPVGKLGVEVEATAINIEKVH